MPRDRSPALHSLLAVALLLGCGGSTSSIDDAASPPDGAGDAAAPDLAAGDAAVGADAAPTDATLGPDFAGVPGPQVDAINRHGVPPAGGPLVLFVGKNFRAPATVLFGATPSPQVSVLGPTQLTAVTPAHAVGPVDLTVENPDGQRAVVAGQFEFAPAPVLMSVAPASGPHEGGTKVVLTGAGFRAVQVQFTVAKSVFATIDGQPTDTSITVTTPALEVGRAFVTVTNSDGQSATLAGAFTAQ